MMRVRCAVYLICWRLLHCKVTTLRNVALLCALVLGLLLCAVEGSLSIGFLQVNSRFNFFLWAMRLLPLVALPFYPLNELTKAAPLLSAMQLVFVRRSYAKFYFSNTHQNRRNSGAWWSLPRRRSGLAFSTRRRWPVLFLLKNGKHLSRQQGITRDCRFMVALIVESLL